MKLCGLTLDRIGIPTCLSDIKFPGYSVEVIVYVRLGYPEHFPKEEILYPI